MVRLRPVGKETPGDLLRTLRPKFLALELRARERRFRWAVPLWALQECTVFALKALKLSGRLVPERTLEKYGLSPYSEPSSNWLEILQTALAEPPELFTLPPGEAFIRVETDAFGFELKQV